MADTSKDLYDEYVKGDSWKCKKSPTKAHYWQEGTKEDETSVFTCKYCVEKRKMPNSWSAALAAMAKKLGKHTAISTDLF